MIIIESNSLVFVLCEEKGMSISMPSGRVLSSLYIYIHICIPIDFELKEVALLDSVFSVRRGQRVSSQS